MTKVKALKPFPYDRTRRQVDDVFDIDDRFLKPLQIMGKVVVVADETGASSDAIEDAASGNRRSRRKNTYERRDLRAARS